MVIINTVLRFPLLTFVSTGSFAARPHCAETAQYLNIFLPAALISQREVFHASLYLYRMRMSVGCCSELATRLPSWKTKDIRFGTAASESFLSRRTRS